MRMAAMGFISSTGNPINVRTVFGTNRLAASFRTMLGDSMVVPIASGERTFISYLVPVGDRTVMVQINAHALDFEMNVTLVNQIVESVEFL